jgi:hypothetical protein
MSHANRNRRPFSVVVRFVDAFVFVLGWVLLIAHMLPLVL